MPLTGGVAYDYQNQSSANSNLVNDSLSSIQANKSKFTSSQLGNLDQASETISTNTRNFYNNYQDRDNSDWQKSSRDYYGTSTGNENENAGHMF